VLAVRLVVRLALCGLCCCFAGLRYRSAVLVSGYRSGSWLRFSLPLVLVSGLLPSRVWPLKMRGPGFGRFGRRDLAVAAYSFSLVSGPTLPADSFRRSVWPSNRAAFPCGNFPAFSAAAFPSGILRPYQRVYAKVGQRLSQARRGFTRSHSSALYAVAYGARRPVAHFTRCHSRKAATVSPPFRRPYQWPEICVVTTISSKSSPAQKFLTGNVRTTCAC